MPRPDKANPRLTLQVARESNLILARYLLIGRWHLIVKSTYPGVRGFNSNMRKDESTETDYPSNVVICISESVALTIPNVANVFTKLNPLRCI